jgi:hypothetical protein
MYRFYCRSSLTRLVLNVLSMKRASVFSLTLFSNAVTVVLMSPTSPYTREIWLTC